MKRKILIGICLTLILSLPTAFAANLSETSASISDDGRSIAVLGKIDSAVEEVVVKVMDIGDTDTTESGVVKAVTVIDMYEKSDFYEILKFEDELLSGRYYIYLSGKDITPMAKPLEIWHQVDTDRNDLIASIYNSTSEPLHKDALFADSDIYGDGKLYDAADKLSLKNNLYKDTYDADISRLLYAVKTMDYDILKSNFNIATAIAAFEANEFSGWVSANGAMATKIWSDSDVLMGKVQKHYNETLSDAGRQNVINLLSGKEYASIDLFNKEFTKAVIYNGIYNANSSLIGHGHYPQLFSECATASGYDFSTYLTLDETKKATAGSQLLQAKCTDFNTMVSKLTQIITGLSAGNQENTHTGGTGGGYNVISGGSSAPGLGAPVTSPYTFNDLSSVEWAKEAIEYLKAKNIVSGVGDGNFEPNRSVKREEFIKMLISALGIEVGDTTSDFKDVDVSAWYAPYVSAAYKLEITSGMGDGTFGIGTSITREQCCAFITRAANDRLKMGEEKIFGDSEIISDYAKASVKALSSAGIIVGDENGNFKPLDNVTRAQASMMIYKLISGGNM